VIAAFATAAVSAVARGGMPPAWGFLIVVHRSAALVSRPMFNFDIAFGYLLDGLFEDGLC
jgi:hypothetical protein